MDRAELISQSKRVVVKLGTAVLMREEGGIALSRFYSFIEGISALRKSKREVLLVTSGAVGLGAERLGLPKKPRLLPQKQACAAVGQGLLMSLYTDAFARLDIKTAQILLTEEDFSNRQRYLNLRSTITELLQMGVIPIFNENDTVSTAELEPLKQTGEWKVNFGDNDKLSALIASKMEADLLLILTDVEGLYTGDPRAQSEARLIPVVDHITSDIEALAEGKTSVRSKSGSASGTRTGSGSGSGRAGETGSTSNSGTGGAIRTGTGSKSAAGTDTTSGTDTGMPSGSGLGRGGMKTKLAAARIAAQSGCATIIAGGKIASVVDRIFQLEDLGTLFLPQPELSGKERWIAFATTVKASLVVNDGARDALINRKASLLPAGVTEVRGSFERGDVVSIISDSGEEFARGIVNYSSVEATKVSGLHSDAIDELIESRNYDALITRDNIAFLDVS